MNTSNKLAILLEKKEIGNSSQETHLGVIRSADASHTLFIEQKIKSGRRALYCALGAGMCGTLNIWLPAALQGYNTFVIPILLYGIESIVLSEPNINQLDAFHRGVLRCLQNLPTSTAIPGLRLLSGTLPIEALIHKRTLVFLHKIINPVNNPPALRMKEIIVRQLATRDNSSNSWASLVKTLLDTYKLPTASSLIEKPVSKQIWKKMVNSKVNELWLENLKKEAEKMSSLKYLNLESCK